jgi:hypothetical protein
MIENLQGRRGAITKLREELYRLGARRSLPVPHELLEHIFKYLVHSYGHPPDELLFVCRTFYVVAMGCRTIWTGLNPVSQFKLDHLPRWTGTFIQSRVARSNPAPLDIEFADIGSSELTDELAKKIAGIPTLLQRCRSVIIFQLSERHFVEGFQPLLESVTMVVPNDHGLDHLFKQLTHLKIEPPLQKGNNPSFHHRILPVAVRLRSLTLTVALGAPKPVIHQSLQTLVLVYNIPWMSQLTNNLGEIVCPELRRLEIKVPFSELLSSIDLCHTHNLSDLRIVCTKGVWYDEDDVTVLDEQWSDSIVKVLRSIGTIKRLELKSRIEVVSGLVEKLEADPTLSPDLETLHAEITPAKTEFSLTPTPLNPHISKRDRSRLLKLEARVSERYQRLGGAAALQSVGRLGREQRTARGERA